MVMMGASAILGLLVMEKHVEMILIQMDFLTALLIALTLIATRITVHSFQTLDKKIMIMMVLVTAVIVMKMDQKMQEVVVPVILDLLVMG